MQLLETDNKPTAQTHASDREYQTALNSIAAGYCNEQEEWVLNELLELCRQGASAGDLLKHIAPFGVTHPERVVSIVRTLFRTQILKAAEGEIAKSAAGITEHQTSVSPVVSRALQMAFDMAAESHSRYQFYSDLRGLGIGQPFAAALAGHSRIRSIFRYRLPGKIALSFVMTVAGIVWFLLKPSVETSNIMWLSFSVLYLWKNLVHALFTFRIPRPTMNLLGDPLKN